MNCGIQANISIHECYLLIVCYLLVKIMFNCIDMYYFMQMYWLSISILLYDPKNILILNLLNINKYESILKKWNIVLLL